MTTVAAVTDDERAWIRSTCRSTRKLLDHALRNRDHDAIYVYRTAAEETAALTVRHHMAPAVQVEAAAMVRYAERITVLAIRAGQEAGEIRRQHAVHADLPSPAEVARFANRGTLARLYDLADDVPLGVFRRAVRAATEDGSANRANVVRHIRVLQAERVTALEPPPALPVPPSAAAKTPAARRRRAEIIEQMAGDGHSTEQISRHLGIGASATRTIARRNHIIIRADSVRGGRKLDASRVGLETVTALEALASSTDFIDLAAIDAGEAAAWGASLAESLRILNGFACNLRKKAQ
ncbi:MAG TPA: hypothetical protein VFQ44_02460 [Streptosporangiaceae bacterium]|nr:hypothetical protein [Streptosporangiaceae bacterium]